MIGNTLCILDTFGKLIVTFSQRRFKIFSLSLFVSPASRSLSQPAPQSALSRIVDVKRKKKKEKKRDKDTVKDTDF